MKIIEKYTSTISIGVLLIFYFIIIDLQKYNVLLTHDYIYPWNNLHLRIPAQLYETLFNNFIPSLLNANPQDVRSGFGLSSLILSALALLICFLLTYAFYLFKTEINDNNKSILNHKSFWVIFPVSFFCIFNPIMSDIKNYRNILRFEDLATSAEYFFVFIPYFLFLIIIYKIIFDDYKPDKKALILYSIIFFILSCYNELFNIASLILLLILSIFIFFYDKKILLNKSFIILTSAFILGFINYYFITNQLSDNFSMYDTTLSELLPSCLEKSSLFFYHFNQEIFIQNAVLYAIFLLLAIYLFFKKNRKLNLLVGYSTAIILGFLIINLATIFISGLNDEDFVFRRPFFLAAYQNNLEFSVLILLGAFFSLIKNKKLVIIPLICVIIYCFIEAVPKYKAIQKIKLNLKILTYKIEKANLVYSSLGEITILPETFLTTNPGIADYSIFIPDNKYNFLEQEELKEFTKNRFFTKNYFANYYHLYFKKVYGIDFKGVKYVPDEIATREYDKRLELFNLSKRDKRYLAKNNVSFKKLTKMFKGKKLTKDNIHKFKDENKDEYLLLKADAFSHYNSGELLNAKILYEAYLKYKKDVDAMLILAQIYKKTNEFDKAKKIYKEVCSIDSQNLMFHYLYMDILYSYYKNYKEALEVCNKMIKLEPEMGNNYVNKGIILLKMHKNREGLEYIQQGEEKNYDAKRKFCEINQISDIEEALTKEDLKLIDIIY